MAINDPIADMLTRIRNAVLAGQTLVAMPSSKIKVEIAKIMKDKGYLEGFEIVDGEQVVQKTLRLKIKYVGDRRARRGLLSQESIDHGKLADRDPIGRVHPEAALRLGDRVDLDDVLHPIGGGPARQNEPHGCAVK